MDRSYIWMLIAAAFACATTTAQAGPCTAQISQFEQQLKRAQAAASPGGAGEASAPQSVGAQLHHQPTPGSVERAEVEANTDAVAALDRAHKADAAGDAAECAKALNEAKDLYGMQ